MCGEKYKIKKRYLLEMGSPPHVRGKGVLPPMLWLWPGITPRMCGEKNKE